MTDAASEAASDQTEATAPASTTYFVAAGPGFYDSRIAAVPENAVLVQADTYASIMTAINNGATLSADATGNPVIKDGSGNVIAPASVKADTSYAPVQTLQSKAQDELSAQQTLVMRNYTVFGDATPDAWITYLKALRAIADGSDTTSTALPSAPAN
ncbi:hypothetical protein [Asaia spathodeae]|uniref:Uncharacterized protein n=1 Tax=Asaia spathodeae TaxID=657016 RepID=A0ABX2P8Y4_9PROT